MTKKLIYLSISFISIALICLVSFQVAWYNNALALKTELYEKSVQEALREVVIQVNNKEALQVITNNLEFFSAPPAEPPQVPTPEFTEAQPINPKNKEVTLNQQYHKTQPLYIDSLILAQHNVGDHIILGSNIAHTPSFSVHPHSSIQLFKDSFSDMVNIDSLLEVKRRDIKALDSIIATKRIETADYLATNKPLLEDLEKKKAAIITHTLATSRLHLQADSLSRLAVLKARNSLLKSKDAQIEAVKPYQSTLNDAYRPILSAAGTDKIEVRIISHQESENIQQVIQQHDKTANNLIKTPAATPHVMVKQQLSDVLNKLVKELLAKGGEQKRRINHDTLGKIIKRALTQQGINEHFLFYVKTDSRASVVDRSASKSYSVALFPHDVLNKTTALQLTIPGKNESIAKSMLPHLLGSILFTGLIMLTFAYTIYVMFKQKRMADIKNDFINNMTHEFKTPIATISLATETINNYQTIHDADKVRHYTQLIKEENQRMNTQVEKVLQLAITDKTNFELNVEQTHLHDMITDAVDQFKLVLNAENRQVNMQFTAPDDTVNVDKFHLTNAITNVLDNAIKYSAPNTQITIATRQAGAQFILSVQDEGIGMSKEAQKKVFEKFYRVQQGNLHDVKGFGIGLSYVKNVIDAHKGSISLQSIPGKGTTVLITFNKV